jgi:hypothetical protein
MKKRFSILIGILITISSFASLPSKVYAPYVDVMLWPTFSLMSCYNATGQKYYTLAFITANGSAQPAWGGVTPMSDNFMLDQIQQLRAVGGDVIVSFGGANGTPIDASITNVNSLVSAYQSVINQYGLTWIDFDIEGYWIADQASIDRRNQAAKILQTNNPGLRITYCLPVMPTGLTADGVNVINKAKAAGVNIYSVNVMAMDYGGANNAMGQAAISAAQGTRSQTGSNIGITPMIGQNDSAGEIFSLSNASEVLNFANANSYVNMIAMWSANRDNGGCAGQTYASPTCSGLSQGSFAFVNTFKSFSGGTTTNPPPSVNITAPANGATYTAPASITINANASDNGSVTQVQFYNGSTLLGTDTSSPYSYAWTNVGAGSYSITAKATDNQGATTTSATVNITVNGSTTGAPIPGTIQTENWTAMSGVQTEATTDTGGGLNVGWIEAGDWMDYNVSVATTGSYNVAFRVASSPGGGQLQLRKGSTTLTTVNISATGGWQSWVTLTATVNLTAGASTLRVYAGASGWNINWMQFTSGSSNPPPAVSITSPSNGASYTAPASITINATASDNGSVTQVQFYNGGTLLGTDTSSPYSFSWTNVAAGTYSLTARATDNQGATTTSSAVSVTVTGGTTGGCSGVAQYVENGGYVAGSKVKNVGNQYQCKPYPYSGWCNGAAWAYAPGTGTYWTDAWTLVGACTARMATEEINGSEIILETEGMTVSPNPVRGTTATLYFDSKAGDVDVHFIHTNGMQISTEHYLNVDKTLEVNVPHVQQGLYVVKVKGQHKTWTKKLVIE